MYTETYLDLWGVMRRIGGTALIEAVLVIIPFLALTIGSIEYVWFFNIKLNLAAAADAAVHVAAIDHGGTSQGSSPNSLDPYMDNASTAATTLLSTMGYSDEFLSSVTVSIDYIKNIAQGNSRYSNGGIPQKEGRRLVGAVVSIPFENAMIFGDFAATLLNLVTDRPEELSVVAFMWRQWKQEN